MKYADAGRWEYPVVTDGWDGVYDATAFGDCCYQHRGFEDDAKVNPFYHREFRRGMSFTYSEDCQYLNISAPKNAKNVPFCCIYTAVLLRAAAQTRGISAVRPEIICANIDYDFLKPASIPMLNSCFFS